MIVQSAPTVRSDPVGKEGTIAALNSTDSCKEEVCCNTHTAVPSTSLHVMSLYTPLSPPAVAARTVVLTHTSTIGGLFPSSACKHCENFHMDSSTRCPAVRLLHLTAGQANRKPPDSPMQPVCGRVSIQSLPAWKYAIKGRWRYHTSQTAPEQLKQSHPCPPPTCVSVSQQGNEHDDSALRHRSCPFWQEMSHLLKACSCP